MINVRRVISGRRGKSDGTSDKEETAVKLILDLRRIVKGVSDRNLCKEDSTVDQLRSNVIKLRNQVDQLTIGKAEMEKDHMNILSSMENEKDHELNLVKARIKNIEELYFFLKVSEKSLVKKVVDLHREEIFKQKVFDEENSFVRNSGASVTHNESVCNAVQAAEVVKLSDKPMTEETKVEEEYDDILDQKQVTEPKKRKSASTSCKISIKALEDTVLQLYDMHANIQMGEKNNNEIKHNTTLKGQIQVIVNTCLAQTRQDAEDLLLRETRKMNVQLLTHQPKGRESKVVDFYQKSDEKDEPKGNDKDAVSLLTGMEKGAEANLEAQVQQKDEVIYKMAQATNNQLSCQKTIPEQKYVTEIKELKAELQKKNKTIEIMCIEKDNNMASIKEKEANFHHTIHIHQRKLEILNELRRSYETELEHNIDGSDQTEEDLILEQTSFKRNALKHEECLRKQGIEIAELKKSLQSQMLQSQEL